MENIFLDIGLIFIIASTAAFILKLFKQPIIPAYIIVGILIGPVFGLVTDIEIIRLLSEIGIAFLLFIVGLELDLKKLKDVGHVASVGAVVQMGLLFGSGFLISYVLGFSVLTSAYLGLILAFSSTMVVIKLLSDKNELDTLHGRIVIGVLLMQDIIAILALSILKDLSNFNIVPFIISISQGLGLLVIAILFGKYVFPSIFKFAARQPELLFLVSLSVCFGFSILFSLMGFSIAVGSFVAGITLANLPYNVEIIARVKSLRDFFSVLFFTAIGAELILVDFSKIVVPLVVFVLFTILVLPFITIIISTFFGYKTRTSFLTGISLAQISEFSLIIVAQGLYLNHVSKEVFSLTIFLAIITMGLTAYFIKYDDWLYAHFGKIFKPFEKLAKNQKDLSHINKEKGHENILIGMDRIGYSIYKQLRHLEKDVVIVDFNPDIIKKLISRHVPCIYGDIGDPEIIEKLRMQNVKMIISTIPNQQESLYLLKHVKYHHKHITIIVTSYQIEDALSLYEAGADYVIVPHYLGGEHVSLILEDISKDFDKLITTKLKHIRDLRHRQDVHPHHR